MNRKKFITSLSVASVGATVFNSVSFSKSSLLDESPIIKAPRLKSGDKLAIVAPGSYISEEELQDSIKNLNELGFETTYSEKILFQLNREAPSINSWLLELPPVPGKHSE